MGLIGYTFLMLDVDDVPIGPFDALPSTLYPDAGAATAALIAELGTLVGQNDEMSTTEADQARARKLFEDEVVQPVLDTQGNPIWDFEIPLEIDGPNFSVRIYPMYAP